MRINKYISASGICSRRQADELVKSERVTVNGKVLKDLAYRVAEQDVVLIDGNEIGKQDLGFVYYLLNKPKGYECTADKSCLNSVLDLVPADPRVSYVGRLDKLSEGLLVLSNDGDLAYKMTHPKFEKEKEYEVTVDKNVSDANLEILSQGLILDGTRTLPAVVRRVSLRKFTIVLREGKNRQIRRMCRKLHLRVHKLKRIRLGSVVLDVPPGEYRVVSADIFAEFR